MNKKELKRAFKVKAKECNTGKWLTGYLSTEFSYSSDNVSIKAEDSYYHIV